MKVLVIGSKGFIGSHVHRFYASRHNVQVYGCDVVTDYTSSNYFLVDATNADYDEIFQSQKFDVCINCSGASSVPDSFLHPQRDFKLNVQNVFAMLDAIRKHAPACKFINLSSAAVYGNPAALPVKESMEIKPLSPYGRHKWLAEEIGREFFEQFGIATCSARIFSAYGPGLHKQIFWDWHKKVEAQGELTILGTGKESRDFLFVEDIARALNSVVGHAKFQGEAINLGSGQETVISEAVEVFKRYYPKSFPGSFSGQVREGDPLNWCADISLMKSFGFEPVVSFEEGLKATIADYFEG